MARTGWSSANYFRYAGADLTAAPLTMACWAKTTGTSVNGQVMVNLHNSASGNSLNQFLLRLSTSNTIVAETSSAAADDLAVSSAAPSNNTWFHACAVFASATSRAAYLNGGSKGTNATNLTPSGINRTTIGLEGSSGGFGPFLSGGSIAEVAIWNVALTDTDVLSLSKGIHPFLVRPDALVDYWPLIGSYSPEINLKSNTSVMTMQGTVNASAHTRIFNPSIGRARWFSGSAPIVAPFYSWQSAAISPPPPRSSRFAAQTPIAAETFVPLGWQSTIITPPLRRTMMRADTPMQDWPFVPLYWPSASISARSRLASSQRADTPMQSWPFTALAWQASAITTIQRASSSRADIVEQSWPFTPLAWQSAAISTPQSSVRRFTSMSAQVPGRLIQTTGARVTSSAFIIH